MIEIHLGDVESLIVWAGLSVGFGFWGISKAIDSYFHGKIRMLERRVDLEDKS